MPSRHYIQCRLVLLFDLHGQHRRIKRPVVAWLRSFDLVHCLHRLFHVAHALGRSPLPTKFSMASLGLVVGVTESAKARQSACKRMLKPPVKGFG